MVNFQKYPRRKRCYYVFKIEIEKLLLKEMKEVNNRNLHIENTGLIVVVKRAEERG
jgi:hypothetical protein